MFRFSERLSNTGRAESRRYLKRAGLFAGGLVLLWIALQLFPTPTAETPVYSDEAGSVASSEQIRPATQSPHLFTLGNVAAFIILVGGGAFAFYLHKRGNQDGGGTSHIESIGDLAIGQGQSIRLIRCGGEVLLIGATSNEITLLRDFDPAFFEAEEEEEGEEFLDHGDVSRRVPLVRPLVNPSTRQPVSSHFADVLRSYAGRYVNAKSTGSAC